MQTVDSLLVGSFDRARFVELCGKEKNIRTWRVQLQLDWEAAVTRLVILLIFTFLILH